MNHADVIFIEAVQFRIGDLVQLRRCGRSCSCEMCPVWFEIKAHDPELKEWHAVIHDGEQIAIPERPNHHLYKVFRRPIHDDV